MADLTDFVASKLTVEQVNLSGKILDVQDVKLMTYAGVDFLSNIIWNMNHRIEGKQDRLTASGYVKLVDNELSIDPSFVGSLIKRTEVSDLIKTAQDEEQNKFLVLLSGDMDSVKRELIDGLSPVDSLEGDETHAPTVKAVKDGLSVKQPTLSTGDGRAVSSNVDSTPTLGNIDRLVTSDGVARALALKADKSEIWAPKVAKILLWGDYTSVASSGSVWDLVNKRIHGSGVALGPNAQEEPGKLKFGKTVVVDSDGKIPKSSIGGYEELEDNVARLGSFVNGFSKVNVSSSSSGSYRYEIGNNSEVDLYINHPSFSITLLIPDWERGSSANHEPRSFSVTVHSIYDQKRSSDTGDGFTMNIKHRITGIQFMSPDPAVFSLVRRNIETKFLFREIRSNVFLVSRMELAPVPQYK